MESIHSFAQAHAVFLSGLILILAYIFIATEKISKVTVALIGACAAIFLDLVSQDKTAGGAANAGDLLFAPTQEYMEQNMLFLFKEKVRVLPSSLPSNAAIYGAAALVWNELKQS